MLSMQQLVPLAVQQIQRSRAAQYLGDAKLAWLSTLLSPPSTQMCELHGLPRCTLAVRLRCAEKLRRWTEEWSRWTEEQAGRERRARRRERRSGSVSEDQRGVSEDQRGVSEDQQVCERRYVKFPKTKKLCAPHAVMSREALWGDCGRYSARLARILFFGSESSRHRITPWSGVGTGSSSV